MQLAERMQSELLRVERELTMLHDRKLYLEAQLPLIKPNAPLPANTTIEQALLPAEERLRALEAQHASSAARYGADHPDIRRLQREITALKREVGAGIKSAHAAEKQRLEGELATLKERYSDDHPDVQRVRRSITALENSKGVEAAPIGQPGRDAPSEAPTRADNPAYLAVVSQLESTKRELTHLSALREDLRAKQRDYDARLLQIPEIEREYRDLTRDYENAQTRYREVKGKQMQAEVAVELEKDRKAERFMLGEPANLPERPIGPDRPRILVVGLAASLGAGLGLGWLRDLFDRSVKGPWELARFTSVRVLTPIPYIETAAERRRNRRRAWMVAGLVALLAVVFLAGVHVFLRPVPEVFDAVLRRAGIW
jgi:uncharacterized protein involved in exopolysaccharide biosynthesis